MRQLKKDSGIGSAKNNERLGMRGWPAGHNPTLRDWGPQLWEWSCGDVHDGIHQLLLQQGELREGVVSSHVLSCSSSVAGGRSSAAACSPLG